MKLLTVIMLMGLFGQTVKSKDSVTLPWHDFKTLYQTNLENTLTKKLKPKVQQGEIFLKNCQYGLIIKKSYCEISFSYHAVATEGKLKKLRLFDSEIILVQNQEKSLADIVRHGAYLYLRPSQLVKKEFSGKLKLITAISEDTQSKYIKFTIPEAVQNTLSLSFIEPYTILPQQDMIPASDERFYLKNPHEIFIRFHAKKKDVIPQPKQQKLALVKTADQVLETITYKASFAENGRCLSIIKFTFPPNGKSRIELNKIEHAKVWYLKINNKRQKLFSLNEKQWVIPLIANEENYIELAYLTNSPKIGINGMLKTVIPAINIPTKKLLVSYTLPKRVELISYDGPISAIFDKDKHTTDGTYQFYKSFYDGEQAEVSLYYKEPINLK